MSAGKKPADGKNTENVASFSEDFPPALMLVGVDPKSELALAVRELVLAAVPQKPSDGLSDDKADTYRLITALAQFFSAFPTPDVARDAIMRLLGDLDHLYFDGGIPDRFKPLKNASGRPPLPIFERMTRVRAAVAVSLLHDGAGIELSQAFPAVRRAFNAAGFKDLTNSKVKSAYESASAFGDDYQHEMQMHRKEVQGSLSGGLSKEAALRLVREYATRTAQRFARPVAAGKSKKAKT